MWRLQRVLDIRKKEEKKKRTELLELTENLAATRGELLIKKKTLKDLIKRLSNVDPKQRIGSQEFFLTYSRASNKQIKKLQERIYELELKQKERVIEWIKYHGE